MTPTEEKLKLYEQALQKVLDDSEIGCVPASHISYIKRLLTPLPQVIYVNEYKGGDCDCGYSTEEEAVINAGHYVVRTAVEYVELTSEIKSLLTTKGYLENG